MNPRSGFHECRAVRPSLRWIVPFIVLLLAVAGSNDSAGSGPASSTGTRITKSVPFVRESIDEIRALAPLRSGAVPGDRTVRSHRIPRRAGATAGAESAAAEPALSAPLLALSPARSAPALSSSFAGLGNPPHNEGDVIPPDTMGAAGPNHLVSLLNSDFGVFSKTGALLQKVSLQSFWASLGTATGDPAEFPFDPKILYDQYSGRFIAITIGGKNAPDSWILLAVSGPSGPTGTWDKWAIDADVDRNSVQTNNSADFPGLGVDQFNVYVTANMYNGDVPEYSKVWVIPKARLLTGSNPITWVEFPNPPGNGFTMQPAHTFGSAAAEYLVFEGSANRLSVARISNPSGSPVWNPPVSVPVASYVSTDALPGAPQLGSPDTIHTFDTRLLNAVYRAGAVWTVHTVQSPGAVKTEVAWYRIDPSAGAVLSQGRVSDPARWYYYPSIGVNANGDVAIGMSGSSSTEFAGGYYTARRFGDPVGTTQPVSLLKAGEQSYFKILDGTVNRWGDFSATVVDPNDDLTFWTVQEYAQTAEPATGASRWGTWWGSFRTSDVLSPDNVVATQPEGLSVRLTWNDRATNESAYVVERRTGAGGTFTVLATLPPNTREYTDLSGIPQGTAAYYRVGAVGALGTSFSDEVLVGTPPAPAGGGGGGCRAVYGPGSEPPSDASLFSAGILLLPAFALGLRRLFRHQKRTVRIRHPLC